MIIHKHKHKLNAKLCPFIIIILAIGKLKKKFFWVRQLRKGGGGRGGEKEICNFSCILRKTMEKSPFSNFIIYTGENAAFGSLTLIYRGFHEKGTFNYLCALGIDR